MIRKALAWTVAATVAAVLGLTGPAQAATVWVPAGCATGSIDPVTVDQGHYLLPTHMSLCEPFQARFNFEIVLFVPGYLPIAYGNRLVSYVTPDPTAEIVLRTPRPVVGVCLMRAVDARVACVRIDTAADGTAAGTPIPVDDPLVAESVLFLQKPIVVQPSQHCATCVMITD